MVIPPPGKSPNITKYLKPYVLMMHFTSRYVSAQVIHSPTGTVACSASSKETALRRSMETTSDVVVAGKIGKILGERLLVYNIPAIAVHFKEKQTYHGMVKALLDNVRNAGVKLL